MDTDICLNIRAVNKVMLIFSSFSSSLFLSLSSRGHCIGSVFEYVTVEPPYGQSHFVFRYGAYFVCFFSWHLPVKGMKVRIFIMHLHTAWAFVYTLVQLHMVHICR